jgi:alanine dehydrogenase
MLVGVPGEVKEHEYRVAMLPGGVEEMCRAGHSVIVERGAGLGSGISDEEYAANGAELVDSREAIWANADLVVKVKEPQPSEIALLREGQLVFNYYHFASDEMLTRGVLGSGVTAIAYETLRNPDGTLPLLTPMSEIAGRMSIQEGARCLERPHQGRGILLGGVPGVASAHVSILGGGVVGTNAAKVAAGIGAGVTILDVNVDRLRYLDDIMPANVGTLFSDRHTIREQLAEADLVIGAVLVPGARAPRLIERADLKRMKPGAVIVDVAVDQGGCCETTRPTTHGDPVYVVDDIVHYAVSNMPGAVGRTSSYALCNVTLPFALAIADQGLHVAARSDPRLVSAVNVYQGQVTNRAVAQTFGMEYRPFEP